MDDTRIAKVWERPVAMEAMRFMAYTEGLAPAEWNKNKGGVVWQWLTKNGVDFWMGQVDPGPAYLSFRTLEGVKRADVGDWLVLISPGELRPFKPNVFISTYDIVE